MSAAIAHVLVIARDIAESPSAIHAIRLALARSRRRETVVIFLTDHAIPIPCEMAHRSAIAHMLGAGARVLIDVRLATRDPTLAAMPGVEQSTEDDLGALLLTPRIDAKWT